MQRACPEMGSAVHLNRFQTITLHNAVRAVAAPGSVLYLRWEHICMPANFMNAPVIYEACLFFRPHLWGPAAGWAYSRLP